ncbi:alpha/beta fold hydrolase [Deinococcus malanensis]|uniref:alpha/beta fold hydrolase n=1 Tax=Deinococcus malanensis TaxID=1706855 RepID=UPI00362C73B6
MVQYKSRVVRLRQGDLEVHEAGEGTPLVLLHGAFTDHTIWNDLVTRMVVLGYRCVVPDLPLGSHRQPMPQHADLSPSGLADLVADLITALELAPATIISNDTATAVMQLVLTRHPTVTGAAVLTSGDAYEHFLPPCSLLSKCCPMFLGDCRCWGG